MLRYMHDSMRRDLSSKVLLLSGPRQCGKTTMAQALSSDSQYLNYDLAEHRILLQEKSWDRRKQLIVFDELHKMPSWKAWLKGIYDVEGLPPALLVTGSAKLGTFRRVGDSLAGRHFHYRLHPIDMKEAARFTDLDRQEIFQRLMTVGGFPEPFLRASLSYYRRWQRAHIDVILKEDLLNLTAIRDLQSIDTLLALLRTRVGSPLSVRKLANDLQKSPNTIRNWLSVLENLYIIFAVTPHHRNIARSLLKAPKYYFYDNAQVQGDEGARLENLVACALWKEIQRLQDVAGLDLALHYLKNKDGQEIDFVVLRDGRPMQMVEVKWRDPQLSRSFKSLLSREPLQRVQVVGELAQAKSFADGTRVEPAADFLADFQLALDHELADDSNESLA